MTSAARYHVSVSTSRQPTVRFRRHPGSAAAGLLVTLSLGTLVTVSSWLALLMIIPAAWTVWAWRAGTEADTDGLRVRALLGTRRIPWSRVDSLAADRHRRVVATLRDGALLPLTAVTAADLPRLAAVTGADHPSPADAGEQRNG